jgi:hypothetical protein
MNIIFLDIDGVLVRYPGVKNNYQKDKRDEFGPLFHPTCVEFLEEIVHKTNAKIVISSSWKRIGIERLKNIFRVRGIDVDIIDIIPLYGLPRGEEIQLWLDEHGADKYIILDDRELDLKTLHGNRFIQTDSQLGITEEVKDLAIKTLS